MANFIKLTLLDEREIFINAETIVSLNTYNGATVITTLNSNDDNCINVKETPERILHSMQCGQLFRKFIYRENQALALALAISTVNQL